MDVDFAQITIPPQPDLLSYFERSHERFAWSASRVYEIQERRIQMSNQLFFDILLGLGGIERPSDLYPPSSVPELQRLLDVIDSLSFDSMKRDCLVYYLLKWHQDDREKDYSKVKCISPHYVALADAYWHLDTAISIGKAVSLLSDARIVKEYSSKVIGTLWLEDTRSHLVLRYVKTCSPVLKENEDLKRYIYALANRNFIDAWQFQRTYPENDKTREFLIRQVLTWALRPQTRHLPMKQLLSLPMCKFEDDVVREVAINPPENFTSGATAVIRDMVCVRLIQSCKYIEAVKFDRQYPSPTDIVGATAKGTWQTERKRIMEQVLSIMPATERAQLDRELEQIAASSSLGSKMSGSGSGGSWTHVSGGSMSISDVSMSWEDIGNKSSFNGLRGDGPATTRGVPRATRGKRVSLLNGRVPTTGSGTSTPRKQPLSAHPTALSQATTVPVSSLNDSMLYSKAANSSTHMQASAAFPPLRVPASTSATSTPNGNGKNPKTNAFVARNAFFQPPANAEDSTPTTNGFSRPAKAPLQYNDTADRSLRVNETQSTVLMDEDDVVDTRRKAAEDTNATITPQQNSKMTKNKRTVTIEDATDSDREDVGYSIFSGVAPPTRRPVPPAKPTSPRKLRKQVSSTSADGYAMPPGAFIEDEPETPATRSSTRAAAAAAHAKPKESNRRKVSAMKSSRKRAASPDDGFSRTIPGGLMDDDEYGFGIENGRHTHSEEEEEEDLVPPLPSHQARSRTRKTRTGAVGAASVGRTLKSRRSSSVASTASTATNETDGEGTGTRIVRRSSRLSVQSNSPPAERKPATTTRPRKSTRTSGPGATATGKGAAKRR